MNRFIFDEHNLSEHFREYCYIPTEKTFGEFIKNRCTSFTIRNGEVPMDLDISHGLEIEYYNNIKYGHGEILMIAPHILWSDGVYKPCHYWGNKYYITLER